MHEFVCSCGRTVLTEKNLEICSRFKHKKTYISRVGETINSNLVLKEYWKDFCKCFGYSLKSMKIFLQQGLDSETIVNRFLIRQDKVLYEGKETSIQELSKLSDISVASIRNKIRKNWPVEKIFKKC